MARRLGNDKGLLNRRKLEYAREQRINTQEAHRAQHNDMLSVENLNMHNLLNEVHLRSRLPMPAPMLHGMPGRLGSDVPSFLTQSHVRSLCPWEAPDPPALPYADWMASVAELKPPEVAQLDDRTWHQMMVGL